MRCWWIAMERRSCESYGLFKGQSLKFMHESIEQKPCAGAGLGKGWKLCGGGNPFSIAFLRFGDSSARHSMSSIWVVIDAARVMLCLRMAFFQSET
jgi:hypothetical protein